MHIRCANKLSRCDPILIHTAKVGGAIQMQAEDGITGPILRINAVIRRNSHYVYIHA
jgi:hypothetical protein